MKRIRKSVFETNSSSMHSLTIGNKADVTIDENEIEITVGAGEYGWGYNELVNWKDKADYLGVGAEDTDAGEWLVNVLLKVYPNAEIRFSEYGYIDHQSYNEIWNEINSEEELYDIIFGNSVIIIDNDNH